MNRLGYLGTIGKQIQKAVETKPVVVPEPEPVQVVEVPVVVPEPEPEPEPVQVVEIPTIEPEPIQAVIEEQYASLPVLASTVSSHTESFSE